MLLPPIRITCFAGVLAFLSSPACAQSPGSFSVISPDPLVSQPSEDYQYFLAGTACDDPSEAGSEACRTCQDINQPTKYRRDGYYATRYCTTHIPQANNNNLLEFTLQNFQPRETNESNSSTSLTTAFTLLTTCLLLTA